MKASLERELKLDVDDPFALPELPGERLAERTLTSTYHDTPPRSLARCGITLRHRLDGDRQAWQLKLPQTGTARLELEVSGTSAAVPQQLRDLLFAHIRHGSLEEVATLVTRRTGVRVREAERSIADVTVDCVDVSENGRPGRSFVELEIELVDGDDGDLVRLGRVLRGAGARRSDGRPKLMRILGVPSEPPPLEGGFVDRLGPFLELQLRQIEAHDPGTRLGREPEDVHRFRVAVRRTRAVIRATRPLLGEALRPLADELKWLGRSLGAVRDADVLLDHLRAEVLELGDDRESGAELIRRLEQERERLRADLLSDLTSDRYGHLLSTFEAAFSQLPALQEDADLSAVAAAEFRKFRKAAGRLPVAPTDAELHALRIAAKHARYPAELVAAGRGRGTKKVARHVDALKDLQDLIGEHQDAVFAVARLRVLADPTTALAVGRLIERQRRRCSAVRETYPGVLEHVLSIGRSAFA